MRYESFFRFCHFLSTIYQEDFTKEIISLTSMLKTTGSSDILAFRWKDGNYEIIGFDIGDGNNSNNSKKPQYQKR